MPVHIDGNTLVFGGVLKGTTASRTRRVDTLTGLWRDPTVHGDQEVYSTYLSVWDPEHQEVFDRLSLEHGYVLMPPGTHGGEYGKQCGHYHPPEAGSGVSYPELYAVLHGVGLFLLQQSMPPYDRVSDVVVIEARTGDSFVVPPNYGHATINADTETLVFEGFFCRDLQANYGPYEQHLGAAYYAMAGADGTVEWVANERYVHLPPPRQLQASEIRQMQGLVPGCCYNQVIERPQDFWFLSKPSEFRHEWLL